MKFKLPEDNTAGIGVDGEWFPAEGGVVDLPSRIVTDYAECIASHGLTVATETETDKRGSGRPRKDA